MIADLADYGINVTIYEPWANPADVLHEYGVTTTKILSDQKYETVVLGVAHKDYFRKENSVLYDVKRVLTDKVDGRL